MKAVREYKTEANYLQCTVTFIPEESDLNLDPEAFEDLDFHPLFFSALVSYPFKPGEKPNAADLALYTRRLQVNGNPNISPALVFDETIRFCQTLKQMYDL